VRGALVIVATVLMLAAGRGAAAQRLPGTTLPMLTGVNPHLLLLDDRHGVRERYAGSADLKSMATRLRRDSHKRDAAENAWVVWFFVAAVGNAAMLALLLTARRRTSDER
jgi:hypothetical protein